MGKLLLGIIFGGLAVFAYQRAQHPDPVPAAQTREAEELPVEKEEPQFRCDGRVHCSEMRSCDEAEFFLAHCPGVKMDGDRDGIPCEDKC